MKDARPSEAESSVPGQGALIVPFKGLPAKLATVTSEVLVRLLKGERMTGLDAVHDAGTTRLAAKVHYLKASYGWSIERSDKAIACRDGRVAWVSEYWLLPELIAQVMAAGGAEWCVKVRAARNALRAKAAFAQVLAARANDAARRGTGSRPAIQGRLFDGGEQPQGPACG